MEKVIQEKKDVVIKFAGDSGDGMQLTGYQFTINSAFAGNEVVNFPEFPSEIRAPRGTVSGVSGFQVHFGSNKILTPGDQYDVLVALNAAALKANLKSLKEGGIIIANVDGFDSKNLRLAKYDSNPLEDESLKTYELHKIPVTTLTREALKDVDLGMSDKDRAKNMFVLGFLYWLYDRSIDNTAEYIKSRFVSKPLILEANMLVLKAGYNFGNVSDVFTTRYKVEPSPMEVGTYRGIMGNHAISLGLVTAAKKANLPLIYCSYPITPASDILHHLSGYLNFGVKTFQAEDEIAAICAAIGAAYGGALAVTGTSGPGMSLKAEAMGLAVMLELPLVICNVQRAGPSTGIPTKTEQADLLQAFYGRHGECPLPILAAKSPLDCFDTTIEACRIAIQHMTPVILLSDGYIANGAEPWKFPKMGDIPEIKVDFAKAPENGDIFYPYKRDENLVRKWAPPGIAGLEHRVGGLEKEDLTGNVSYTPENHEKMVKIREEKINKIANFLPELKVSDGPDKGKMLVLGWGSTYGTIASVVSELLSEGFEVAHLHLRHLMPFANNLGNILSNYEKILVPEINNGQLVKIIREKYLVPAIPFNKIEGIPIAQKELKEKIIETYK